MLKSIAYLKNVTSKKGLKSNSDIQALYYPKLLKKQYHHSTNGDQDERFSKSHGTLIVAFASDDSSCRILYYNIEPLNSSPLLQSDVSFLQCKCASFPKAIQVFSLQNNPAGVPSLIAMSTDGCLYKSQSLIDMGETDITVVQCKLEPNVNLIGMDFLCTALPQCYLSDEQETRQAESEKEGNGWMLVAGSCSLSPPTIVILPHDETIVGSTKEIRGLEEAYCEVTAIKVFHKSSIGRNTWDGIKYLWKLNANGSIEPIWESINLSIVMFGYSDGSVYVAIVSMGLGTGPEASNAVKVHEAKAPMESIISFCLTNMEFEMESGRGQLLCVGSLGSIISFNKEVSNESYGFTKVIPSSFNETSHLDNSSTMGLLV